MSKKHSLATMINMEPARGMRGANSHCWAGALNTYFWFDPLNGLAGVVLMQSLPFCDPAMHRRPRRLREGRLRIRSRGGVTLPSRTRTRFTRDVPQQKTALDCSRAADGSCKQVFTLTDQLATVPPIGSGGCACRSRRRSRCRAPARSAARRARRRRPAVRRSRRGTRWTLISRGAMSMRASS